MLVSPTGHRLRQLRQQLRSSSPPPTPVSKHGHTGLAVITYNRIDCLKVCIASIETHRWGNAQVRVIVDDGSTQAGYEEFLASCQQRGITIIRHSQNQGVAHTKNDALRFLMEAGCDHLFLIEDDILLKSETTLAHYIDWGERTGLQHLNFALHGETNRNREFMIQRHGQWILCYPTTLGAFSYYTRLAIERVGYFDHHFHNAFEHIDHTYRMTVAELTLPFGQFADHPLNVDLLEEQHQAVQNSVIRQGDWLRLVDQAKVYWVSKHGAWPPPKQN
jgi:glycosyltransferase involved in cell wall biosynthesis